MRKLLDAHLIVDSYATHKPRDGAALARPPFRRAEFDIMFNEGISRDALLVDLASELGIIDKSGAWYSYGKERIGQGRDEEGRGQNAE